MLLHFMLKLFGWPAMLFHAICYACWFHFVLFGWASMMFQFTFLFSWRCILIPCLSIRWGGEEEGGGEGGHIRRGKWATVLINKFRFINSQIDFCWLAESALLINKLIVVNSPTQGWPSRLPEIVLLLLCHLQPATRFLAYVLCSSYVTFLSEVCYLGWPGMLFHATIHACFFCRVFIWAGEYDGSFLVYVFMALHAS